MSHFRGRLVMPAHLPAGPSGARLPYADRLPLILSLMCHSERSEESHSMTLALWKAECQTVRSLASSG
jgi:hypothetical protein